MGTLVVDEVRVIGRSARRNVYRIPDVEWQYMQEYIEGIDPMLPCGHRGLSNTPDGYTCSLDLCDKLFSREEVDA
jgi:hypothetical protein